MTNLTDEILRLIGKNRNFRKNYNVVRNLLNNGKAPLDISLNLLPMLNPTDLKKLGMNKNIPETLRATAVKLMRQRNETIVVVVVVEDRVPVAERAALDILAHQPHPVTLKQR